MASTAPALKRSESIADSMPEALRQSRYHMKRCFAKYIGKGKRLMKLHHLMGEMDQVIDDKAEKTQLLDGLLGYILCTTQCYKKQAKQRYIQTFYNLQFRNLAKNLLAKKEETPQREPKQQKETKQPSRRSSQSRFR
ncbi:sucrose synthase 7-like [Olea europaea subsp. europaea]|nr:sucrose synthase 7-like [Olea europaea subsp. europaea]